MCQNVGRTNLVRINITERCEIGEGEVPVMLSDELLSSIQPSAIIRETLEMELQSGEGAPQTVERWCVVETEAEQEYVENKGQNRSQLGSESGKLSLDPTPTSPRAFVGKVKRTK